MARSLVTLVGVALAVGACATGTPDAPDLVGAIARAETDGGANASGSSNPPSTARAYRIGGTVTGLVGADLVLVNNGEDLAIARNGAFAFATTVATGKAFNVTVKAQPTAQTCSVANGTGTVAEADVNLTVTCAPKKFTVGGTVTGLVGTGLVLANKGGELAIAADGSFTFPSAQDDATTFAVSVKTQPQSPAQACVVSAGSGTIAGGDVSSVLVNCSKSKFAIGGTVTGLDGTGLVLRNNGGDAITVNANSFAFPTPLDDLAAYAVTIETQPKNKWQTCTVSNEHGNVAGAAVTNVSVRCTTNKYKVKATVTGLDGSGLVLQNNGGSDLAIANNGTFEFTQLVASGASYVVTTKTNPTNKSQTCTVSAPSGTIFGADVTASVNCSNKKFAVSGTVTGLAGSGLVLRNNGGDAITVSNNSFSFPATLEDEAAYAVTIGTQPTAPWQTCTVSNASGAIDGASVTNVVVNCGTNKYKVKATVTGLDGSGLVLQNNGGSDLAIPTNGTFEFTPLLASGSLYAVSTRTNPTNKRQSCVVTGGGSGTISNTDVTATVACTTPPANVVLNPGFETPNANWACQGSCGFDTGGTFSRSGIGNGWVRNDNGWNAIVQTVSVTANRTYQVSAWIRTSANNTDGYFGVRTTGGTVLADKKFGNYPGYTQITVMVSSGSNTSLVVYGGLWATSDTYLQIDDVVAAEQ